MRADDRSRAGVVDFGYGAGVLGCNMCAPGLEQCKRFGWESPQLSFTTVDIHGTSDENIFVIGDRDVAHFDGLTWSPVDLSGCFGGDPVSALHQVWAIGNREAFVSSTNGAVLHLTSAGCTKLQIPNVDDLMTAVWASSASDLYVAALGNTNGLWHYDGTTWTMALAGGFFEVWGTSPTDVFAIDNADQFHHFTGTWAAPQAVPESAPSARSGVHPPPSSTRVAQTAPAMPT